MTGSCHFCESALPPTGVRFACAQNPQHALCAECGQLQFGLTRASRHCPVCANYCDCGQCVPRTVQIYSRTAFLSQLKHARDEEARQESSRRRQSYNTISGELSRYVEGSPEWLRAVERLFAAQG